MRAGGGKAKGSAFERLVCEKLSLWISGGERDDLLWRSAMSGGRATVKRKAGKANITQGGDICAIAPEGHVFMHKFVVECKHVRTLNIQSAVVQGKQELANFWRQVSRDAASAGKRPLLIAKQNSYPILAFTRTGDSSQFFGPVSIDERARLFTLGRTGAPSVSMFLLEDLLRRPYVEFRFK